MVTNNSDSEFSEPDTSLDQTATDYVSKSQRKRDMQALQDLGQRLTTLTSQQWSQLPLSDDLNLALEQYHKISRHEAKRRQLQYIGKLMRSDQLDRDAIIRQLDQFTDGSTFLINLHHQAENWRKRMLDAGGRTALTEFIEHYPEADPQQLGQLARNAKKDSATHQNRGHGKKLYRYLRQIISSA